MGTKTLAAAQIPLSILTTSAKLRQVLQRLALVDSVNELLAVLAAQGQSQVLEVEVVAAAQDAFRLRCAGCGELMAPSSSLKYCPCKTVAYCSRACQKTHWTARHKAECATRNTARGRKRL